MTISSVLFSCEGHCWNAAQLLGHLLGCMHDAVNYWCFQDCNFRLLYFVLACQDCQNVGMLQNSTCRVQSLLGPTTLKHILCMASEFGCVSQHNFTSSRLKFFLHDACQLIVAEACWPRCSLYPQMRSGSGIPAWLRQGSLGVGLTPPGVASQCVNGSNLIADCLRQALYIHLACNHCGEQHLDQSTCRYTAKYSGNLNVIAKTWTRL